MTEMIQNRETFLNKIAGRLGRGRLTTPVERPKWKFNPQDEVMKNATQDELVEVLKNQCEEIHTNFYMTDTKGLAAVLNDVVHSYGGGPVLAWKDDRFAKWGLQSMFTEDWPKQDIDVHVWDYQKGEENIRYAEKANVAITISDITLAESGTVVIYGNKNRGRSTNFMPICCITLVPKSTIVPRMTQAAKQLREIEKNGDKVPSAIHFISGPSNSADIELNLIVGVHGPVKASYILINDL